jgi:penicillin-binding protein 1A
MPRKSKKKSRSSRPLPMRLLNLLAVLAVWGGIFVILLTGWYAAELPGIVKSPDFKRKTAITIRAADGTTVARYGELKGVNVSVEELPPHLIYAVIATEDRRFYEHRGVDPVGLARAIYVNFRAGHYMQGGSTITQQLAKNLFLSPERKLKRKIQEALLALWLEKQLTKDEILSAYLNRVYLGSGVYGVDAASRLYFGKPAQDVNLREAAMLAGLLKAPSRYAPNTNPELAAQRVKVVLSAMVDAGYITEEEAREGILSEPLPEKKPLESDSIYYFTDWIIDRLNDLTGTPVNDMEVQTTFNPSIQQAAQAALTAALNERGAASNITQGAVIVMAPDGAVLAMVGGRDYDASQFNRATQAMRSPGSSFKPVVFLTALLAGWHKDDLVVDAPLKGQYHPENYKNEYMGEVRLETALAHSLNTATVRLAQTVGIGNVLQTAKALGIATELPRDLSMALGSGGVPMLEMATAYATIANGGYRVMPYSVTRVVTKDGDLLYNRIPLRPRKPSIDPRAIRELDDMLEAVVREGTGRGANLSSTRVAGKTGTSQDFRDAWFIGYTNSYVAAVWVGNDDNTPMNHITGGSVPAQIWRSVMTEAQKEKKGFWPLLPAYPGEDKSAGGFAAVLQRLLGD